MSAAARRVLVAGIGNIFLGDDGFGVEVVRRIDAAALPPSVDVADYGIRGIHLAYDLLDGRHDTLIMVDAVPLDGPPGTLAVLDARQPVAAPATDHAAPAATADPAGDAPAGKHAGGRVPAAAAPVPPSMDGHGLHPQAVLALLHALGGRIDRVLVVGCRPEDVGERMGLSGPVRAVLDEAVRIVTALARNEAAGGHTAGAVATGREPTGA